MVKIYKKAVLEDKSKKAVWNSYLFRVSWNSWWKRQRNDKTNKSDKETQEITEVKRISHKNANIKWRQ